MEVVGLFPKLLVKTNVSFFQKELDFIINQKTFDTDLKNGKMSVDNYLLDKKPLKNLKTKIQKQLEKYFYEVLKLKNDVNIKITNSWSVINKPNDSSHTHKHYNSFCSGVLYLKKPKNSGNIVFHRDESICNDNISPRIAMEFEEYNPFNTLNWTISTNEGDLILFPSLLSHSTEINNSNEDRIILAFNVFLDGKFNAGTIQEVKYETKNK